MKQSQTWYCNNQIQGEFHQSDIAGEVDQETKDVLAHQALVYYFNGNTVWNVAQTNNVYNQEGSLIERADFTKSCCCA